MHDTVEIVYSQHPSDVNAFQYDSVGPSGDESRLLALGHKPELKHTHTFWSCEEAFQGMMRRIIDG